MSEQQRTVVVARADSLFECATASILKCTRDVIIAPNVDEQPERIAQCVRDILQDNPHIVFLLDGNWSREFVAGIIERHDIERSFSAPSGELPDSDIISPVVIILAARVDCANINKKYAPDADSAIPSSVIAIEPRMFMTTAPCNSALSATSIFEYLITSEFPAEFPPDRVQEAQWFRIALRATSPSTLATYKLLREIVCDWQRVAEPETIMQFGRFITQVGPQLSRHHAKHHGHIVCDNGATILFIEAPGTTMRTFEHVDIIVRYSIDTEITRINIEMDSTSEFREKSRDIFANLVAECEGHTRREDDVDFANISRDLFFVYLAKKINATVGPNAEYELAQESTEAHL